jgi:hypothetical protein
MNGRNHPGFSIRGEIELMKSIWFLIGRDAQIGRFYTYFTLDWFME